MILHNSLPSHFQIVRNLFGHMLLHTSNTSFIFPNSKKLIRVQLHKNMFQKMTGKNESGTHETFGTILQRTIIESNFSSVLVVS